ncbi:uncharacterized protein ATC70_009931 [Mucor velutinosus]|uniref:Uncharacterized protein n=1 Tax=Mucor velutinosus TaxID=708070 RepID=A0AAN7DLP9_9FUNG|nr:hypothetical protein ATC70_009931 [Mucor velutinosus]
MSTTTIKWDLYDDLEQEHEYLMEDDQDGEYDWPEYSIPNSDIVLNRKALQDIRQQLEEQQQPPQIRGTLSIVTAKNDLIGLDNNLRNSEIGIVQSKGSASITANITATKTTAITYSNHAMTLLLVLCVMVWLGFQFKKHRSISAEKSKQLPYYSNQN